MYGTSVERSGLVEDCRLRRSKRLGELIEFTFDYRKQPFACRLGFMLGQAWKAKKKKKENSHTPTERRVLAVPVQTSPHCARLSCYILLHTHPAENMHCFPLFLFCISMSGGWACLLRRSIFAGRSRAINKAKINTHTRRKPSSLCKWNLYSFERQAHLKRDWLNCSPNKRPSLVSLPKNWHIPVGPLWALPPGNVNATFLHYIKKTHTIFIHSTASLQADH